MNSEGIQGRLPEQGNSSCISKDKLEISSWKWEKCSPKFAKTKIKGGGKRFTGGMWGQHTKLKEFNIQALRWRHLGSNGDPETKTRAWNPARPYLITASLYMIAVFPLTKDWFLPANGFHSDPSSTATQEGRHVPPNSSLKNPQEGLWPSFGHVPTLDQELWPGSRGAVIGPPAWEAQCTASRTARSREKVGAAFGPMARAVEGLTSKECECCSAKGRRMLGRQN